MKKHSFSAYLVAVGPALVTLALILLNVGTAAKAGTLYAQAEQAASRQEYGEARGQLQRLNEIAPEYVPQYLLGARIDLETGSLQAAYATLQTGIEQTGSRYLIQLAQTLAETGTLPGSDVTADVSSPGVTLPEDWLPEDPAGSAATETLTCNYDFIIRYTDSALDPQVQLEVPDAPDAGWTWTSSNTAVAQVDAAGLVTCQTTPGEACIQGVTPDGKAAECWVFVLEQELYQSDTALTGYYSQDFYYIPEGELSIVQQTVQSQRPGLAATDGTAQQLPRIRVTGDSLNNAGFTAGPLSQAQGSSAMDTPVDQDGNPITESAQPVQPTGDGGQIDLHLGWEAIYFSGEYRIPAHLRSNGATYTTTNVYFEYGASFTSVSVPDSVVSLSGNGNPFASFTALQSISVDPGNPAYRSLDGVLYDASMTTLLSYPAVATATEFTVPDTVTAIGPGAFADNQNLQTLTLPAGVTEIGDGALVGMQSLTRINAEGDAPAVRLENGLITDAAGTRLMGVVSTGAEDCTLPASIRSVDFDALSGAPFRHLTVDASMEYLLLNNCPALESVTVNGAVNALSLSTCPTLRQVTLNNDGYALSLYGCAAMDTIELNGTLYLLDCSSGDIQTLTNPQNVVDSLSLSSSDPGALVLADTLNYLCLQSNSGEAAVDLSAISGAGSLRNLQLSNVSVTGFDTIARFAGLEMLTMWNVQTDSFDKLWSCTALTSLTINQSDSLTDLNGIGALSNLAMLNLSTCPSLTDVSALRECTALRSLSLSSCEKLTDISAVLDLPSLNNLSIHDSPVPDEQLQALVQKGVSVY